MFHSGLRSLQRLVAQRTLAALALGLFLISCAAQSILYESRSAEGTIIVSQDRNGMRTLLFEEGGARQSVVKPGDPEHLELPYTKAALVGLALTETRARMLVIGLGGGTLPMFLRHHYPQAQIDAVDISPHVVEVARRYFGFREDERMKAHVADGRKFIETAPAGAYDLIFLDAYGAHSVPAHLTTREFLLAVRRALAPQGVVVGNIWGRNSNPLYDAMVRTYQEVFDELYVLSVRSDVNNILLALPRREVLNQGELAGRGRKLSGSRNFRFDLGEVVEAGFTHARSKNPEARVLQD